MTLKTYPSKLACFPVTCFTVTLRSAVGGLDVDADVGTGQSARSHDAGNLYRQFS